MVADERSVTLNPKEEAALLNLEAVNPVFMKGMPSHAGVRSGPHQKVAYFLREDGVDGDPLPTMH